MVALALYPAAYVASHASVESVSIAASRYLLQYVIHVLRECEALAPASQSSACSAWIE